MIDDLVAAFAFDEPAGDQSTHRMHQQRQTFVIIFAEPGGGELLLELDGRFRNLRAEVFVVVGQHKVELLVDALSIRVFGQRQTLSDPFGVADDPVDQQQNVVCRRDLFCYFAPMPRG